MQIQVNQTDGFLQIRVPIENIKFFTEEYRKNIKVVDWKEFLETFEDTIRHGNFNVNPVSDGPTLFDFFDGAFDDTVEQLDNDVVELIDNPKM